MQGGGRVQCDVIGRAGVHAGVLLIPSLDDTAEPGPDNLRRRWGITGFGTSAA
ncbi:hypothetical protein C4K39_1946 [Pseudomonas sessilinigenes]|nr:hypothetical protein C4K39_1946 [Pseudomonas sessilinigenes]